MLRALKVFPEELKLKLKAAPESPKEPDCRIPRLRSLDPLWVAVESPEARPVAEATFLNDAPVSAQEVAAVVSAAVVPREEALAPVRTVQLLGKPLPIPSKFWV
jgi:hypothetical protein